jgi:uncharacterized protein YbjT (DUF2867 family)
MTILVTGATGRVGWHTARLLTEAGVRVRAAITPDEPTQGPWAESVPFSYTDPATWPAAFNGVEAAFIMRPPQIGNVRRDMLPALRAARAAGVRRMALLSLQGADRNPFVPHRQLETWLRGSGLQWTFVRAAFFMQNLSTTHAAEIRDRGEIVLPAGQGRTAFVDVRDVAAVAAVALSEPGHESRAYTPTGPAALTYDEVAQIVSVELGRQVRYRPVGALRYFRHARRGGMQTGMALVTTALYAVCRFGLAAGLTDDVRTVTGRAPVDVATFVHDERAAWQRPAVRHGPAAAASVAEIATAQSGVPEHEQRRGGHADDHQRRGGQHLQRHLRRVRER